MNCQIKETSIIFRCAHGVELGCDGIIVQIENDKCQKKGCQHQLKNQAHINDDPIANNVLFICPSCGKTFCQNCFIGVNDDNNAHGQCVQCPECGSRVCLPQIDKLIALIIIK